MVGEKPEFVCFNAFYASSPVKYCLPQIHALLDDEEAAKQIRRSSIHPAMGTAPNPTSSRIGLNER